MSAQSLFAGLLPIVVGRKTNRRNKTDRRSARRFWSRDRRGGGRRLEDLAWEFDPWLFGSAAILLVIGFIMVSSSSVHISHKFTGGPWHFTLRQGAYIGLGLLAAYFVLRVRLARWAQWGPMIMIAGMVLLIAVLIPGIGREVNGASRWINLVFFNLQVSELVKLGVVIYLAGYLVRRGEEVRTSVIGFLKPMAILSVISILLLSEPDFGATTVMMATALGLMFLAGVRLWQFGVLVTIVAAGLAALAVTSPYRMQRLTSFVDPWPVVNEGGYQLAQSLIAIGRGEFWGVGLGNSIQKMFYLPEGHTDFIFAVMVEETGMLGAFVVIALFAVIVFRAFKIGMRAEKRGAQFSAYLIYGFGLWIGLQAFIHIGVNLGALPTKGLTLPLVSYGGSSMVVTCMVIAFMLRVDMEVRYLERQAEREVTR